MKNFIDIAFVLSLSALYMQVTSETFQGMTTSYYSAKEGG